METDTPFPSIMKKSLIIVWMLLATADKAFMLPVNRSQTECTIPKVMVGEPTALTCYFSSNLNETKKGFFVQHVSQTGEMTEALSCLWMILDRPKCETAPGYIFDEQIGNTLTLRIPRAAEQFVGTYRCIVTLSDPNQNLPCNFNLAETSLGKTFNRTSSPKSINQVSTQQSVTKKLDIPELGEKKGEAKDKSWIPVISVLVPVGLLALVLVLIWYKRRKNQREDPSVSVPLVAAANSTIINLPISSETRENNLPNRSPQGFSTPGTPADMETTWNNPLTGSPRDKRFSLISGAVTDMESESFFENGQYERALRLVKEKGTVVITGPKGCGKSAFGHAVLDHYQEKGFCPLKLDHPDKWLDEKQGEKKYIVLFDECEMDNWPVKTLTCIHLECYVIFIRSSDAMNSGNDGNVMQWYLQYLPTVDLGQKVPRSPGPWGTKLLFQACQDHDAKQVITILNSHSPDPNCPDRKGKTPLHIACEHGQAEIVSELLSAHCRANTKDYTGLTPLHYVCSSETCPAELGCNQTNSEQPAQTTRKQEQGETDDRSRGEIVIDLTRFGASVNAQDGQGRTPLHYACECSSSSLVRILIKAGANVTAEDVNGCSPLHVACQHGNGDIVKSLTEAKSDVNKKDNKNCTPLHEACNHNRPDIIKSLLDAKSDVNAKNASGATPLHVACLNKASDSVKVLLCAKADVDARNDSRKTPLHLACVAGSKEIVQMLLDHGADTEAIDTKGDTPAKTAKRYDHMGIVDVLSQKKVTA